MLLTHQSRVRLRVFEPAKCQHVVLSRGSHMDFFRVECVKHAGSEFVNINE